MSDQPETTLSERLTQGPLSKSDAQQYAASLADALRRLHDQGLVVGTLDPSRIMLSGTGVKIATIEASTSISPYISPEQLNGNPPDTRSDIFAFGAIFQEMLTGRKAFANAHADELRAAILERDPAPLPGEPAEFAKLISKCLAKSPLQRWQRIQHVQMELKLHTVFARRSGQDNAAKAERMQEMVRASVSSLEARMHTRFEAQERKLQAALEVERALRAEIVALEARVGSRAGAAEDLAAEHETRLAAFIDEAGKRAAGHDALLAASSEGLGAMSARLAGIDQTVKTHSSSLESLQSAVAQTDDLVERVVEALDSLERSVIEQNEMKFVAGHN